MFSVTAITWWDSKVNVWLLGEIEFVIFTSELHIQCLIPKSMWVDKQELDFCFVFFGFRLAFYFC